MSDSVAIPAPPVPAGRPAAPAPPPPGVLRPDLSVLAPSQELAPAIPVAPPRFYNGRDVPPGLALPRRGVKGREVIDERWEYPEYPEGREGLGLLPHSTAKPNRWFIDYPKWQRYMDVSTETPYQYDTPRLFHPYQQSKLKGDVPIIGEDIFLDITAKDFALFEFRKLPTAAGSARRGRMSRKSLAAGIRGPSITMPRSRVNLFRGETSFKPVEWALRVTAVYNQNFQWVNENNLLSPDPRGPDYHDSKGNPDTGKIQAIPGSSSDVNPRPGIPAPFTKTVNPGDVFNYLAPQLQPLGNASKLKSVDSVTNTASGSTFSSNKGGERHRRARVTPIGIATPSRSRRPSRKSISRIFRITTTSSPRAAAFSRSSRIFAGFSSTTPSSASGSSATWITTGCSITWRSSTCWRRTPSPA